MAISKADLTTVTHVVHFSLAPQANGTLNVANYGLTPSISSNFVSYVHGKGKTALICVGGAGSELGFRACTASGNLNSFVTSLLSFVSTNHYDGVDIDWEPLLAQDVQQYTNFIAALRSGLNQFSPVGLLTVAAPAYPDYSDPPTAVFDAFASIQNDFDQINIMTYDLSGPYGGWVTWFNSPIVNGGFVFPSDPAEEAPSINAAVTNFTSQGVAPGKLAIGIPFYGYVWGGTGLTQPRESWVSTPTFNGATYDTIISNYYTAKDYHWDTVAQASYLSITNAHASNDMFISYEDATACTAKVADAQALGLGGLMVWELSQDYSTGHPLMGAIDNAVRATVPPAAPVILTVGIHGTNINFTFSTVASGKYRVQYSTDLSAWHTLVNTLTGSGSPLFVADTNGLGATARYYRIKVLP